MSIKNLLRKAAELVVELPEDQIAEPVPVADAPDMPTPRTVEEIVKDSPGPDLTQIQTAVTAEPAPATAPDGQVNFAEIYRRAGLPTSPFSAEQALDVLGSLPADLSLEIRRKTVQATLSAMGKAMGVNTESVVADASRKLAALAAYSDSLEHGANTFIGSTQAKILELERQIAEQRQVIADTQQKLATAVAACQAEADRLDDVLEFFTADVPPSKHA